MENLRIARPTDTSNKGAASAWSTAASTNSSSYAAASAAAAGASWASASAGTSAGPCGAESWADAGVHSRAAAWAEVPSVEGFVPCRGSGGFGCPHWAWVAPRKVRCRTCAAASAAQAPPEPSCSPSPPGASAADPWADMAPPVPPASTPLDMCAWHLECLKAAQEVARRLAQCGEFGFSALGGPAGADPRSLQEATTRRVLLLADCDVVPAKLRKLASHCGGVPPRAGLSAFKDPLAHVLGVHPVIAPVGTRACLNIWSHHRLHDSEQCKL